MCDRPASADRLCKRAANRGPSAQTIRSGACSTPSTSTLPEPDDNKGPMKRQADDLSRDWVSRFRDEDAGVEVRT